MRWCHLFALQELCNHAEVAKDMSARRQCMLTFGALVHKINQSPKRQQDTKAKAACQQYVQVTQHCKASTVSVTLLSIRQTFVS